MGGIISAPSIVHSWTNTLHTKKQHHLRVTRGFLIYIATNELKHGNVGNNRGCASPKGGPMVPTHGADPQGTERKLWLRRKYSSHQIEIAHSDVLLAHMSISTPTHPLLGIILAHEPFALPFTSCPTGSHLKRTSSSPASPSNQNPPNPLTTVCKPHMRTVIQQCLRAVQTGRAFPVEGLKRISHNHGQEEEERDDAVRSREKS